MAVYANRRDENRELNCEQDAAKGSLLLAQPALPMGSKSNSNGYHEVGNVQDKNGNIGKEENFYETPKEAKEETAVPEIQNTYLTYLKPAPVTASSSCSRLNRILRLIGLLILLVLVGVSIVLSAWSVSLIKAHIKDFEKHIKNNEPEVRLPTTFLPNTSRPERRTMGGEGCFSLDCGSNASCIVSNGSYVCTCNAGFQYDGQNCADIDECSKFNTVCDRHAVCINTPGSYRCNCTNGFTGNGLQCSDIDECENFESTMCDRNAVCINTEGSYQCNCPNGFTGNGLQCSEVDLECTSTTPLGMESGSIPNNTITASNQQPGYESYKGRLNNARSWWPGFDNEFDNVWIQVDLQKAVYVAGIQTQGDGGNEPSVDYVTQLQIQYGDNVNSLMAIKDGDITKTFVANTDATSVKTIRFPEPVRTRYIRVIPTAHAQGGAGQRVFQLRMEILGCS